MARILLLGGTAEAAEIAARLAGDNRLDTVTSLAGLTQLPTPVAGRTRRGGFGGPDGLAATLTNDRYDALIDATHPFAARIAAHAAEAAERAGVPRLKLVRPPFQRLTGDTIHDASSIGDAVALLPSGARVFVAAGRREAAAFAARPDLWCLVRMIEAPAFGEPLPPGELVLGRPASDWREEAELLRKHRVEWIVSKDSGGRAGAKIVAARNLGLPIVLVSRPKAPEGPVAESVGEVVDWVEATLFASAPSDVSGEG
ncbi:precorrin-6A/cobalt-precorrin-6A reductase [Faunimonas pinastri]|uniref:Precorrin-6A/cobalt-precorrin-6A reductase n=1 Tax=Faunimonas pinastri TaxID=1855383 RepID=A0A1H9LZ33_9HYPH|nr:cobalt-precorrin-6A reductase [Faunimonas pinastri]SER16688.1 precorrin-6A/cobalt-precorrin-6A reductase [Faunimonas pinastri]